MTAGLRLTLTPTSKLNKNKQPKLFAMAAKLNAQLDLDAFHTFVSGSMFCVKWKTQAGEAILPAGEYNCKLSTMILPVNCRRVFLSGKAGAQGKTSDNLLLATASGEAGMLYLLDEVIPMADNGNKPLVNSIEVAHHCRHCEIVKIDKSDVEDFLTPPTEKQDEFGFQNSALDTGPVDEACPMTYAIDKGKASPVVIIWDWAQTYPDGPKDSQDYIAHWRFKERFSGLKPLTMVAMDLTDGTMAWYPIQKQIDKYLLEKHLMKDTGGKYFAGKEVVFLDGPDILLGYFDYDKMIVS